MELSSEGEGMTWGVQPARTPEEVDKRINLWHSLPDEEYEVLKPSLNDYLGWTKDGYWSWVMTSKIPEE